MNIKILQILSLVLLLLFSTSSVNAQVKDLDPKIIQGIPQNIISQVESINNNTEIIGTIIDKAEMSHCYLWNNGKRIEIKPIVQDNNCYVSDINDSGVIVGYESAINSGSKRAFLYRNGSSEDFLNLPLNYEVMPNEVNNNGQVVGQVGIPDNPTDPNSGYFIHGFVWEDGLYTQLPCQAIAIDNNNLGQVVAYNESNCNIGSQWYRGMLWENGNITDLDFIPSSINDKGEIVGRDSNNNPVLWKDDVTTNLPTGFSPISINNSSVILGTNNRDNSSYIFHNNQYIKLNSFQNSFADVGDLNDHGMIVGESYLFNDRNSKSIYWKYN
jgi:probable HAF family extracellular repeat protein